MFALEMMVYSTRPRYKDKHKHRENVRTRSDLFCPLPACLWGGGGQNTAVQHQKRSNSSLYERERETVQDKESVSLHAARNSADVTAVICVCVCVSMHECDVYCMRCRSVASVHAPRGETYSGDKITKQTKKWTFTADWILRYDSCFTAAFFNCMQTLPGALI